MQLWFISFGLLLLAMTVHLTYTIISDLLQEV
jgi:hypothetical protein